MVVVVLVVVISPPSIFTLRSLRLLASPVKSDGYATSGFFVMCSLCVHYDVLGAQAPVGLSNEVGGVGGRTPLRTHTTPPSPTKTTSHSHVNSQYAPYHHAA